MPKVNVLPDHIASQIAAGEVVERPSSVVKELVENSIDAGATQIEIVVGSDCRDIRVADNGCGMEPEDAVLAFHRHATSKISSAEDLWSLRTMGFRGEALPSIASVSKLTCYTKTADSANGTKVTVNEGQVTAVETGCSTGTAIEVVDLFYNVPARLKFLRKASTEFSHIHEIVQQLAVAHPKVMFQLINEGEVVLRTTGSGKLAHAMVETGLLTGREELCTLTYADVKTGIVVYGYVGKPTSFRGDRKGILSIVNNRPVRCPVTYKALDNAFADLIPKGKHPIGVLTVTLDQGLVDINVHPTKKEIKYSNGNDIYQAMYRAIDEALRLEVELLTPSNEPHTSTPQSASSSNSFAYAGNSPAGRSSLVHEEMPEPAFASTSSSATNSGAASSNTTQLRFSDRLNYVPPQPRTANPGFSQTAPSPRTRSAISLPAGWRLLGYLHNTYFLFETPEGLEIIEQHIAHERYLYEQLLSAQETPGRLSETAQRLVISTPLVLSPEQRATLEENVDTLAKLGFGFEIEKGSGAFCTQIPLELAQQNHALVIQQILTELSTANSASLSLEATKSVACQAAIKNGMPLSESDIYQLVSDWLKTERNDTCPHGRPIRLKFSMEKLFQLYHPA